MALPGTSSFACEQLPAFFPVAEQEVGELLGFGGPVFLRQSPAGADLCVCNTIPNATMNGCYKVVGPIDTLKAVVPLGCGGQSANDDGLARGQILLEFQRLHRPSHRQIC